MILPPGMADRSVLLLGLAFVLLFAARLVVLVAHKEHAQSHPDDEEQDAVARRTVEPGKERRHRPAHPADLGTLTTGHGCKSSTGFATI